MYRYVIKLKKTSTKQESTMLCRELRTEKLTIEQKGSLLLRSCIS